MSTFGRALPFGKHDIHMALLVTRREVRDAFRDWRIIIPIILLTLVFPALATLTARVMFRFTEQFGAELIVDQLIPFLLLIVGFFPMTFSLVIALETFVGEKERKSLEPLLATPLSDTQLYVGKVLAAVIPPMTTSYLGIIVYLIGLTIFIGFVVPISLLFQILLLSTIQGLIMVAAAVIVSSQTNTVRASNLLASFIIVPIALLLQFEAIVLFWGNEEGLWWLILALLLCAIILMRMGVKIFNREELLGQDFDRLNLGWTFGRFWDRFAARDIEGKLPHPLKWYRRLVGLLPTYRLPASTLMIALVSAFIFGLYLAGQIHLPEDIQAELSGDRIHANMSNLEFMISDLPRTIFLQNIRVIIFSAVLGIFTLGVTDIIIFALPWILIGVICGQLAIVGESPLTFLSAAILPHAVLELPALLLANAALLRWHMAVLHRPADGTVSENWLNGASDFGRIFFGLVIPLLLVAAYVEAYVTPKVVVWFYSR